MVSLTIILFNLSRPLRKITSSLIIRRVVKAITECALSHGAFVVCTLKSDYIVKRLQSLMISVENTKTLSSVESFEA